MIAEYPDSGKVGVLAEFSEKGDGKPTLMRYIIRDQAGMTEYWEGERTLRQSIRIFAVKP